MSFLSLDTIVEATDDELAAAQVSHCRIADMRIWIQLHDASDAVDALRERHGAAGA